MSAHFQVGIIGAGFAGLMAGLRLKKSGLTSFTIFERAAEIGGTWRDNTYPECACDVASYLYCFADEPKPDWSQRYARQPEILGYLKDIVATYDLEKHIRFNTDIVAMQFRADTGNWLVTDRQGNATTVTLLLLAMGPLNRPNIPPFPGLDSFRGRYFHSAQWDHTYDLRGKRVAVIGTGASAIQIIPAIAPLVAQLTVLQRTPAWVMDRFDATISPFGRWLNRHTPGMMRLKREMIYWLNEWIGLGFIGNASIHRLLTWMAMRKLKRQVTDPHLRQQLTPTYTIGCKRILRSDNYYPTFNRPNVSLVTAGIERFTPEGILTDDGQLHSLDAVIFGTGFLVADLDLYTRIIGLAGRSLIAEWKKTGAEAYLGTTVPGFPNLAFLLGPNTGLGHNSVLHMMESQMQYLLGYIRYLQSCPEGTYLDLKEEALRNYNKRLQEQFGGTVWQSGCQSWYINAAGKNTTLYPRLTVTFRKATSTFDPTIYQRVEQTTINRPLESAGI